MSQIERSAEWVYQGVWRVLSDCFRVPQHPPALPSAHSSFVRSFHPSRKYLSYLKLYFWFGLVVIDVAILVGWLLLWRWNPLAGWILAIPALVIAVVPDIVAYVAMHLRYDTMWYVMTDRSLRARRGIWIIYEHTITFENVQNVYVRRGPIEQLFGIATVVIETAGSAQGEHESPFAVGNQALIEGIDNANEIRQMIMEQVRMARSAGLGDEPSEAASGPMSAKHLELLREIRDELRATG